MQADPAEEASQRQRRWLRVLLLASLAILLVAISSELPEYKEPARHVQAATIGPDDQLITPGDRVGFLRLGLQIGVVEQRLGKGRAKPTERAVLYKFEEAGLTCAVQRSQVISVLVQNPMYRTAGGLSVGSDADLVVRELGDEYEYEPLERVERPGSTPTPTASNRPMTGYTLHYWREGVHVNLFNDRVESIMIMAPTSN